MVWAVLVLSIPSSAAAQWFAPLKVDDRVELVSRSAPHGVQGRFVRATTDSVWLRQDPGAFTVPFAISRETRIRVQRGTKSRIGSYALKGMLIGAAIGASLGFAAGLSDDEFSEFFGGPLGGAAITGGIVAVPGALIGALLGISVPVWEPVSVP